MQTRVCAYVIFLNGYLLHCRQKTANYYKKAVLSQGELGEPRDAAVNFDSLCIEFYNDVG